MKYVRYLILAAYNMIRLSVCSLIGGMRLKFYPLQLISPKAKLLITKQSGGSIKIGQISVLSGTLIKSGGSIEIGNKVFINRNCNIVAREKIIIEDNVSIGPNCVIYDHDHDMKNFGKFVAKAVIIRKKAWIGANSVILKGIEIGEGAVIGAGSVVTHSVPPHTIYAGNPAVKIGDVELD